MHVSPQWHRLLSILRQWLYCCQFIVYFCSNCLWDFVFVLVLVRSIKLPFYFHDIESCLLYCYCLPDLRTDYSIPPSHSWCILIIHLFTSDINHSAVISSFCILSYPDIHHIRTWAATCDFQKCGIFTSVISDEPLQPPFKVTNSK